MILNALMAKVELNGYRGTNYLKFHELYDEFETPSSAHLLLDVEDGRGRRNTEPGVSLKNIQEEGRTPYTVWHGLIHVILFPHVLQHHNLDLVGSCYDFDRVPCLRSINEIPMLYGYWKDGASPRWGAPSAGSVVGA